MYRRFLIRSGTFAAAVILAACVPSLAAAQAAPAPTTPLKGYVDMHAHPMTHLAFGGKLIHGAPDIGSLVPTDSSCRQRLRAMNMNHALDLDKATHGGWDLFKNPCGDAIRIQVIKTMEKELDAYSGPEGVMPGAPLFPFWPRWDDITHQKMWIDWVKRAHQHGLRVMVALATHNQTLAAAVSGPGDGPPDDRGSGDLQINEMKTWVQRHWDFMEIAYTPADLRRIVGGGKLAVVLGVELDGIGNINNLPAVNLAIITAEIRRLHRLGVRYIFPIHVIDNPLGGTAVYGDLFNLSNYRESGHFWDLECAPQTDRINYRFKRAGFDAAFALVKVTKLGISPTVQPREPPACPTGSGHVNMRGLTPEGISAIKEMMRLGMLIDIDHMSQRAANQTLQIADEVDPAPGRGYPLNSGHNGFRGTGGNENSRTDAQLRQIAALGGIIGVGMEAVTSATFHKRYTEVATRTGWRGVALGTDFNGLVRGPRPNPQFQYDGGFQKGMTGPRAWDYSREGVAHYGMLPDFLRDVQRVGGGNFERTLHSSAEHFAQMWEQCEARKSSVR